MTKIDLIIPMYNSERFIPQLLDSLECQTFKDFTVIFVDDGSTDHTCQILREQLANVPFAYEIIQQENKGLPGARNAGIRAAKSEWIAFMDSDDGLDEHYLEFLIRAVENGPVNIGVCSYQMLGEDEPHRHMTEEDFSVSYIMALELMQRYYKHWFGACALILNREWLKHRNLLFDEECTYLEDIPFITQVIVQSDKIALIDAPVYIYYQRKGSLIHSPKIEKYQIGLDGFDRMTEKISGLDNPAAREFKKMGYARYYLATLHKGATLMPYNQFTELCERVPLKKYSFQFPNLPKKQKYAAKLYVLSKWLFYNAMRIIPS